MHFEFVHPEGVSSKRQYVGVRAVRVAGAAEAAGAAVGAVLDGKQNDWHLPPESFLHKRGFVTHILNSQIKST